MDGTKTKEESCRRCLLKVLHASLGGASIARWRRGRSALIQSVPNHKEIKTTLNVYVHMVHVAERQE